MSGQGLEQAAPLARAAVDSLAFHSWCGFWSIQKEEPLMGNDGQRVVLGLSGTTGMSPGRLSRRGWKTFVTI